MIETDRIHNLNLPSHHWHKVFAWFPVYTIKGRRIWWDYVYKRAYWYIPAHETGVVDGVEYGDIFDVLSDDHGP